MSRDQSLSIEDLAQRYAAGETVRGLAASINRSYGFVHSKLSEVMQLRPAGPPRVLDEDTRTRRRSIYPTAQSRAQTALCREHHGRYRELYQEQQQTRPDATPSAWQSAARTALGHEYSARYRQLYLAAVADLRAARFEDRPGPDARVKALTPSGAAGSPPARESDDAPQAVRAGANVTAPPT
jgi:hypothetical protein